MVVGIGKVLPTSLRLEGFVAFRIVHLVLRLTSGLRRWVVETKDIGFRSKSQITVIQIVDVIAREQQRKVFSYSYLPSDSSQLGHASMWHSLRRGKCANVSRHIYEPISEISLANSGFGEFTCQNLSHVRERHLLSCLNQPHTGG
jgi:hypothetical protein